MGASMTERTPMPPLEKAQRVRGRRRATSRQLCGHRVVPVSIRRGNAKLSCARSHAVGTRGASRLKQRREQGSSFGWKRQQIAAANLGGPRRVVHDSRRLSVLALQNCQNRKKEEIDMG